MGYYIVDDDMRVLGAVASVVVEEAVKLEEVRRAHREQIPVDAPVINCPTDGIVAALEANVGASHDAGWVVKCPLCNKAICVGRFAVVLILAQLRRLKEEQSRARTT